jgi:hypothetical protein
VCVRVLERVCSSRAPHQQQGQQQGEQSQQQQ